MLPCGEKRNSFTPGDDTDSEVPLSFSLPKGAERAAMKNEAPLPAAHLCELCFLMAGVEGSQQSVRRSVTEAEQHPESM